MKESYDVYLAGPFFNDDQKETMAKARAICEANGLTVCDPQDLSPVIVDMPEEARKADDFLQGIFDKNVEGMERSWMLLACIDGRDTGTAFELGWFFRDNITRGSEKGIIVTFSGKGFGCNVMLARAAYGHLFSLVELEQFISRSEAHIRERRFGMLLRDLKGEKAGSTE